MVDILEPHVGQAVISKPLRTKALASAKIKTDKVDAEVLALRATSPLATALFSTKRPPQAASTY